MAWLFHQLLQEAHQLIYDFVVAAADVVGYAGLDVGSQKHLAKAAGLMAPQKTGAALCRDSSAARCCPREMDRPPSTSASTALLTMALA